MVVRYWWPQMRAKLESGAFEMQSWFECWECNMKGSQSKQNSSWTCSNLLHFCSSGSASKHPFHFNSFLSQFRFLHKHSVSAPVTRQITADDDYCHMWNRSAQVDRLLQSVRGYANLSPSHSRFINFLYPSIISFDSIHYSKLLLTWVRSVTGTCSGKISAIRITLEIL